MYARQAFLRDSCTHESGKWFSRRYSSVSSTPLWQWINLTFSLSACHLREAARIATLWSCAPLAIGERAFTRTLSELFEEGVSDRVQLVEGFLVGKVVRGFGRRRIYKESCKLSQSAEDVPEFPLSCEIFWKVLGGTSHFTPFLSLWT